MSAVTSVIPGLPHEVSCRIISLLGAPYTWSEQRQEGGARLTASPKYALSQEALLSPARVGYIKSIHLDILLATYDDAVRQRVESDEDKRRNNEIFSIAVCKMFRLSGPGNDYVYRRLWSRKGLRKDLLDLRYRSSYLELLPDPYDDGATVIPHVNSPFTTFIVHGMPLRRLFSPAACCHIAARMHRLKRVNWQLWDNEKKDIALRRRMRDDFARTIPELPPSIEDSELRLHYSDADDYANPRAVSEESYDFLSAALGRWSRNLRKLYVQVSCLSHDFFIAAADGDSEPSQPAQLRNLTVELSSALPSGAWLLAAHPDEDDDSRDSPTTVPTFDPSDGRSAPGREDQKDRKFRQSPVEKLIQPLIVNIAGAVGSLPELKRLDVSTGPRRAFSIVYDVDKRLLEIQANPKIGPEEDTMVAWKDASRVQIGSGHVLTPRLVRANVEGPPVEDVTEVLCEL